MGSKYSDKTISDALSLREDGLSAPAIEAATGMKPSTVQWYCMRFGAESPTMRQSNRGPYDRRDFMRHGYPVRAWTPAEDAMLLQFERAGTRLKDRAEQLGRTPTSCRNRLMALARHEARREAAEGIA